MGAPLNALNIYIQKYILIYGILEDLMIHSFDNESGSFTWDLQKESLNVLRHGIDFAEASQAFFDPHCLILEDDPHSMDESRYYCVGNVMGKIVTVRFTYREGRIRIFGAGYWRKWRKIYETKNSLR